VIEYTSYLQDSTKIPQHSVRILKRIPEDSARNSQDSLIFAKVNTKILQDSMDFKMTKDPSRFYNNSKGFYNNSKGFHIILQNSHVKSAIITKRWTPIHLVEDT